MGLEGVQFGHYRLQRLIGSGGMGEVYFAEDTRISRKVAVKVVRNEADPYPNAQATADAVRLFQREMKAITTLDHPNILPLIDFGEETVNTAMLTYMVMPFRSEGSLVDWLHKQSSTDVLPPQEVVHIVLQAAGALQHAHNHQLMHLDVKPANFLIRRREDQPNRPDLLLADFGIAKFNTATATASQSIRGTPAYMAPEQWAGNPVAATDQYALAVMAYQLLTGKAPFQGNMQQVLYKHLQEFPQPPSTLNSRIPTSVDAVILRALAKKPEDRFPSIQAFATAFKQAWQSGKNAEASAFPPTQYAPPRAPLPTTEYRAPAPSISTVKAAPLPAMQNVAPVSSPKPPLSSKKSGMPRLAIILGLIVLVVVGVGGISFALSNHSFIAPTPTSTYSQLNASYSGTYTGGTSGTVQLLVDSQDQQGNITARVSFNTDIAESSCNGSFTLDKHITLVCSSSNLTFNFNGNIYSDGHIEGTDTDNRNWNIS